MSSLSPELSPALVQVYDLPIPAGWQMLCAVLVETPGASKRELADRLGISIHTVGTWLRKPEFQRYQTWYVSKMFTPLPSPITHPDHQPAPVRAKKLQEEISEYAVEMWDKLKTIADTSENEKLVVEIAKDVLDRAGHQAQRKVERPPNAFVMTPELVEMLMQRSVEAKVAPVIEGEVLGKGPVTEPIEGQDGHPLT